MSGVRIQIFKMRLHMKCYPVLHVHCGQVRLLHYNIPVPEHLSEWCLLNSLFKNNYYQWTNLSNVYLNVYCRWYPACRSCHRSRLTDWRSSHCWPGSRDCTVTAAWAWRLDRWNVWGEEMFNVVIALHIHAKNSRLIQTRWVRYFLFAQVIEIKNFSLILVLLASLVLDPYNTRNSGWHWWRSWHYGVVSHWQQVRNTFNLM